MSEGDPTLDAVLGVLQRHDMKRHAIEIATGLSHADCDRALRLLITIGQVKAIGGSLYSGEIYSARGCEQSPRPRLTIRC